MVVAAVWKLKRDVRGGSRKLKLTVGNGGPDAGEHEEQRGDELGHIGLERRGAQRVAKASKCELHHLFFFFLPLPLL
jgi:hypothetical protein